MKKCIEKMYFPQIYWELSSQDLSSLIRLIVNSVIDDQPITLDLGHRNKLTIRQDWLNTYSITRPKKNPQLDLTLEQVVAKIADQKWERINSIYRPFKLYWPNDAKLLMSLDNVWLKESRRLLDSGLTKVITNRMLDIQSPAFIHYEDSEGLKQGKETIKTSDGIVFAVNNYRNDELDGWCSKLFCTFFNGRLISAVDNKPFTRDFYQAGILVNVPKHIDGLKMIFNDLLPTVLFTLVFDLLFAFTDD